MALVFVARTARAQSVSLSAGGTLSDSPNLLALAALPDAPVPAPAADIPVSAPALYVPPTNEQKFRNFAWNALGPVAFAGSSFAAAIDQGFNFPHKWGQGADASLHGVKLFLR